VAPKLQTSFYALFRHLALEIIAKWKFLLSLPRCAPALPTLRFSREFGLGDFVLQIAVCSNFIAFLLF